ncbi:MAG: hypothetical protein DGJ47_000796 [Rickettsiaceae bacterium]
MQDSFDLFKILEDYFNGDITFKKCKKTLLDLHEDRSINFNCTNAEGESLLTYAITHPNSQKANAIVSFLAGFSNINMSYYNPNNNVKDSILHLAIKHNLTQAAIDLIRYNQIPSKQTKININATNLQGKTPLHYAISLGSNLKIIDKLISANCNVNTYSSSGETPLITAAKLNKTKIVESLLRHPQIKVNSPSIVHYDFILSDDPLSKVGCTSSVYAMKNNNKEMLKKLLLQGGNILCLGREARDGYVDLVLSAKKHPGLHEFISLIGQNIICFANESNLTPLQNSIMLYLNETDTKLKKDKYEFVQFLIKQGRVNINEYTKNTVSPIRMAVEGGDIKLVNSLIDYGAILQDIYKLPHPSDKSGVTWASLIDIAAGNNNFELFKLLFENSLKQNYNPHFSVAVSRCIQTILINSVSSDPNKYNPTGAIKSYTFDHLDLIVEKYPKLKPLIEEQKIKYSTMRKNLYTREEIIKKIESNKSLVDYTGDGRDTPLHQAVQHHNSKNNCEDLVLKLLTMGADPMKLNNQGQSVLTMSALKYNIEQEESDLSLFKIITSYYFTHNPTILHECLQNNIDQNTVDFLIESNLFLDVQDANGNTPIHIILHGSNTHYQSKILRKISELPNPEDYLNVSNKDGITPLDIILQTPSFIEATKQKYLDIYKLCQAKIANDQATKQKKVSQVHKKQEQQKQDTIKKQESKILPVTSQNEVTLKFIASRKSKVANVAELKQIITQHHIKDGVVDVEILNNILSSKKTGFIKLLINEFKLSLEQEQLFLIVGTHCPGIIDMFLKFENNKYQQDIVNTIVESNKTKLIASLNKKGWQIESHETAENKFSDSDSENSAEHNNNILEMDVDNQPLDNPPSNAEDEENVVHSQQQDEPLQNKHDNQVLLSLLNHPLPNAYSLIHQKLASGEMQPDGYEGFPTPLMYILRDVNLSHSNTWIDLFLYHGANPFIEYDGMNALSVTVNQEDLHSIKKFLCTDFQNYHFHIFNGMHLSVHSKIEELYDSIIQKMPIDASCVKFSKDLNSTIKLCMTTYQETYSLFKNVVEHSSMSTEQKKSMLINARANSELMESADLKKLALQNPYFENKYLKNQLYKEEKFFDEFKISTLRTIRNFYEDSDLPKCDGEFMKSLTRSVVENVNHDSTPYIYSGPSLSVNYKNLEEQLIGGQNHIFDSGEE